MTELRSLMTLAFPTASRLQGRQNRKGIREKSLSEPFESSVKVEIISLQAPVFDTPIKYSKSYLL